MLAQLTVAFARPKQAILDEVFRVRGVAPCQSESGAVEGVEMQRDHLFERFPIRIGRVIPPEMLHSVTRSSNRRSTGLLPHIMDMTGACKPHKTQPEDCPKHKMTE